MPVSNNAAIIAIEIQEVRFISTFSRLIPLWLKLPSGKQDVCQSTAGVKGG
jgi:hypothetical protein